MKKSLFFLAICLITFGISKETYAMRVGAFELHPFIDVTEQYTDNVFYTNSDKESDFSTIITPGIQLIYPKTEKRYRLELVYQATIELYNRFSSENAVSHRAVGKFQYKMPSGFDFYVGDQFTTGHDARGVNIGRELDFYRENTASASIGYAMTDRIRIQGDYSYYTLNYEEDRNSFRDRTDNIFAGYLFYKFMPKTSAFVEYEYVIVDFDESDALNSREHHIFGGIAWDVTGKTKGTIKGGMEIKEFDDSSVNGYRGYIMEIGIDHNFTSRHAVKIIGLRRTNESNIAGADFSVTTGMLVEYYQKLTGKITGKAFVSYVRDDYRGSFSRRDSTWKGGVSLSYQMKKWLRTEAGYSYTIRNSTIDDFDYTNNTYYFRVSATL